MAHQIMCVIFHLDLCLIAILSAVLTPFHKRSVTTSTLLKKALLNNLNYAAYKQCDDLGYTIYCICDMLCKKNKKKLRSRHIYKQGKNRSFGIFCCVIFCCSAIFISPIDFFSIYLYIYPKE